MPIPCPGPPRPGSQRAGQCGSARRPRRRHRPASSRPRRRQDPPGTAADRSPPLPARARPAAHCPVQIPMHQPGRAVICQRAGRDPGVLQKARWHALGSGRVTAQPSPGQLEDEVNPVPQIRQPGAVGGHSRLLLRTASVPHPPTATGLAHPPAGCPAEPVPAGGRPARDQRRAAGRRAARLPTPPARLLHQQRSATLVSASGPAGCRHQTSTARPPKSRRLATPARGATATGRRQRPATPAVPHQPATAGPNLPASRARTSST